MKKLSLLAFTLALPFSSQAADQVTSLTVYGNSPQSWDMPYYRAGGNMPGYGIISFARQVGFNNGTNSVVVGNVPDEIDPSSIMVKKLGRNLSIVEQNFTSAQLSQSQLIRRNIGREIEVEKYTGDGVVSSKGVLLDSSHGLVLQDGSRIRVINDYSSIVLPGAEGVSAGSSIEWLINSTVSGDAVFEYSYKTQGISWAAGYNIYIDGKGTSLMAKLEGWANLVNSTSINIKDTALKLVAGQVAQAPQAYGRGGAVMMAKAASMDMVAESAPSMQQEKFSDYHMYTIGRKVSLAGSSSKMIKLFDDREGVLATRKYMFDAGHSGDNSVKSVVAFTNDDKSRLGLPLPGGKYRVFEKDASGAYEQVGETTQPHRAEGEKLELVIGNSFDLKADRKQVDSEQDALRRRGKYTVTVEIESALDEEVEVLVKEPVYQQNWEILSATHEHKKITTNQVEFTVKAKPKGKTKLEYIVQYSW